MRRFLVQLLLAAAAHAAPPDQILRDQTQALLDAVTYGRADVWDRYLDERVVFASEDGSVSTKAEIVKSIRPLPQGVSGVLRVTDFKAVVHGNIAVTNYVADENETYYGHALHCQYRTTDTWLKGAKGWRMIGSQTIALRTDPPAIALPNVEAYVGNYALTPEIRYEIRNNGGKLEGKRTGREWEALLAEAPDVFFTPGKPRYRKVFQRNADANITGFAERREAWDLVWARVP